ncbi:MAG TPA: hypothetical protein VEB65_07165, partial [Solirubrobacterales bacterium]|nr:hypothetical protein [Solirubrobacterales bacterium]
MNETGTEVFFASNEELSGGDTDDSADIYLRRLDTGETELVSGGEAACSPGCGNGAFDVSGRGISADGSHAYFTTEEALSPADGDTARDIYARDLGSGQTVFVSRGECGGCGNGGKVPVFDASSADGEKVFFSSDEALVTGDDDARTDVYMRDLPGGPTTLVSGGSDAQPASFAAASADGAHVFFTTAEGLLPGTDGDTANDVYEWTAGGPLTLVTSATCTGSCGVTFDAASEDSSEVVFQTAERLALEDTDSQVDLYRQAVAGGEPVLVSRGDAGCPSCWNGPADVDFNEAAGDASRVIFGTEGGVLGEDTDGEDDIYLRDVEGETTSLITTSPSYCPLKKGNCGATFAAASSDGRQVYFRSVERFTLEDGDDEADVYERFLGLTPSEDLTRLVSTRNSPDLELEPEPPALTATDPASPSSSRTPRVIGDAEAGTTVKIYPTADCSGEPIGSGSAAELASPGLQVSVAAGSLTRFRATAEADGFVSKCSEGIGYRHMVESSGEDGEEEVKQVGGGGDGEGGASAGETTRRTGTRIGGGEVAPSPGPAPGPTYLTPRTRITFAPASKTRSRRPTFRFTDATGQSGTRFRCKVDRKPWRGCKSPLRLKRLSTGRHVLRVLAVNGAGA